MDWNKRWKANQPEDRAGEEKMRKKWNYVFLESLKMSLFLPLVILFTEIFILNTWPDLRENPGVLLYDYLFLFSMIFLVFVIYHLLRWNRMSK